jgi:hypothetical protein
MPNKLPAEIKGVIDMALTAFNSKNGDLFESTFAGEVVIVDGMAPYRWTGPNAQSRWLTDAKRWAHELGVSNEHIAYDKIVHAEVVGTHAYVVLSATLSFTLKGERGSRSGILTYTFVKQGEEWKIESQAWGRLS